MVGAAVRGIDWRQPIDAATADAVRDIFTRHSVLCFPDQKLVPDDQVRFANVFGQADGAYRKPPSAAREKLIAMRWSS